MAFVYFLQQGLHSHLYVTSSHVTCASRQQKVGDSKVAIEGSQVKGSGPLKADRLDVGPRLRQGLETSLGVHQGEGSCDRHKVLRPQDGGPSCCWVGRQRPPPMHHVLQFPVVNNQGCAYSNGQGWNLYLLQHRGRKQ